MATNTGGWLYEANGTPVDKATADNAQARVLEIKQTATSASMDATRALQTANAYAGQIAQANTTAGRAEAIAQGAESTADNAADRVDALEVMGGVQPGSVNDANMKLHAEQDGGLFNTALKAQSLQVRRDDTGTRYVREFMEDPGASDQHAAFQAAIDDCPVGGTVHLNLNGADARITQTLVVDKPIKLTSGTTTPDANRLVFPVDVTGIHVRINSVGRRPMDALLENIYLRADVTTRVATGDVGFGIYNTDGRVRIDNVMVEHFSNHGVFFHASYQAGSANTTKSVLDRVRVTDCWGNGMKFLGNNTQEILIIKPDIVSCRGWGMEMDTANSNTVIDPHFDQSLVESPGIIRDCANSNDYGVIYVEPGGLNPNYGRILLDKVPERESIMARFESIGYAGELTIEDRTTAKSAIVYDRVRRSTRRDRSVHSIDNQHRYRDDVGITNSNGITSTYVPGAGSAYAQKVYDQYTRSSDLRLFSSIVRFGDRMDLPRFASTNRPASTPGAMIFDDTLKKVIVHNGTQWVDMTGNPA